MDSWRSVLAQPATGDVSALALGVELRVRESVGSAHWGRGASGRRRRRSRRPRGRAPRRSASALRTAARGAFTRGACRGMRSAAGADTSPMRSGSGSSSCTDRARSRGCSQARRRPGLGDARQRDIAASAVAAATSRRLQYRHRLRREGADGRAASVGRRHDPRAGGAAGALRLVCDVRRRRVARPRRCTRRAYRLLRGARAAARHPSRSRRSTPRRRRAGPARARRARPCRRRTSPSSRATPCRDCCGRGRRRRPRRGPPGTRPDDARRDGALRGGRSTTAWSGCASRERSGDSWRRISGPPSPKRGDSRPS
jgi:hypothetical protein